LRPLGLVALQFNNGYLAIFYYIKKRGIKRMKTIKHTANESYIDFYCRAKKAIIGNLSTTAFRIIENYCYDNLESIDAVTINNKYVLVNFAGGKTKVFTR
jgi:hypothetical protein